MGVRGHTERSLPHTAAVTPESLRSCLGRGGIGTPRGGLGAHEAVPPPHSGGYTRVPPVLPGPRRDRDAPLGLGGTRSSPFPTQRRLHPSPSGPAWAAEGWGRPVGVWGHAERSLPHTAAATPASLRSCLGRGGIGTPRGGLGARGEVPPAHSGGYTRVPLVLPGARRDGDAPWGFGDTRRGPSPTHRRLHPSPSGPAWAAEG